MSKPEIITLFTLSETTYRINVELLKDYFRENMPDIQLNYYIGNFDKSDYNMADVIAIESNIAEKESDLIIGLDGNVDPSIWTGKNCKKILLLTPENRIFSPAMKTKKGLEKYIRGYDYVITGSSYWDNLFRPVCSKIGISLIENVRHPVAAELKNPEQIKRARRKLEKIYPELTGKRIFSVLVSGSRRFPKKNQYTLIDLEELLSSLPDDVTLVTNCMNLRFAGRLLPMEYSDRFIYFKELDIFLEVLLNSEWIITNVAFVGAVDLKKTVGILRFSYNYFENYIAKNYENVCITTPEGLKKRILDMIDVKYDAPEYKECLTNTGEKEFCSLLYNNRIINMERKNG